MQTNLLMYSRTFVRLYLIRTVYFVTISLASTGCSTIAKLYFGIDQQVKFKTQHELREYIKKHNFDSLQQYYLVPAGLKYISRKSSGINKLYVFDSSGCFLTIDTSVRYCNGRYSLEYEYLLKSEVRIIDSSFTIHQLMNSAKPLYQVTVDSTEKYKYYIVLSWATYAGRFNQLHYQAWLKDIKRKAAMYGIKVISISTDFIVGYDYSILKASLIDSLSSVN